MTLYAVFVILSVAVTVFGLPHPRLQTRENLFDFELVTRDQWHARPATITSNLETPVEYVIIHHTYQPGACHTTEQCSSAMRGMQNYHQQANGWGDIGYNFAVGGDGKAYEGRGWNLVGAHTYGFNTQSIGIVLIGDWRLFDFELVTRDQWHARPATITSNLETPVEYVIIHHTYQPGACHTTEQCSSAMRGMQNYHQQANGWGDIGYNFAVGGDGKAYEGRGWNLVGAHTYGFNTQSIGIVLIGDWRFEVPPAEQLEVTKKLIAAGVELGIIRPNYKLIGHRQAGSTECPGGALFDEISTWDRFRPEV